MRLLTVEAVRDSIGFSDMVDINSAIEAGLETATSQLATILRTSFDRGEMTDTFFANGGTYTPGPSYVETQFLLSNGFVELISVGITAAGAAVAIPMADANFSAIGLNAEKGIVSDRLSRFVNSGVGISYTYGFLPDDDDVGAYDQGSVPQWLKDAALTKCLLLIASSPAITGAQITLDTNMLQQQFAAILNGKQRYAPLALLP